MKNTLYRTKIGLAFVTASLLTMVSCTGDFEHFNTDPNSAQQIDPTTLITSMELDAMYPTTGETTVPVNNYQTGWNLLADHYAGYMACANPVSYTHLDVYKRQVRCRSSAANSPFVLLFGIPRQIKQPAKASKPNASTECLRLLRIYRFKLCERFETDPYRYSYRRQRGSLDHRQASEDGYTVPCQTSPRC